MTALENIKKWYAIDVSADPAAAEALEFAFNSLDSLGTEINHLRKSAGDGMTITGYFDDPPNAESLRKEIDLGLKIYGVPSNLIRSIEFRDVEDTDWLAEWKRHWRPTVVGQFVIAPPWSDVDDSDKIIIRIEPNMAFGTGTHETTKLCLEAIGRSYTPGQTFLDVGTGTGILAIAAAKLSDSAAIAGYETDEASVRIAAENAVLNQVGDRIDFTHGPITDDTPAFDFVCANLTLDVIGPLLSSLLEKTRKNLVLSGILVEQKDTICDELDRCGAANYDIQTDGEWISVFVTIDQ